MAIFELLILLVAVVLSTVLHELAHGWVAYWLGDTTAKNSGRLSLNPLHHIDPYMSILIPVMLYLMGGPIFGGAKPVPVDSRNLKWGAWGMALVALAGPLTNLILGFLVFVIGVMTGAIIIRGGEVLMLGGVGVILANIVMMELGFAVFNMIPIPPLDGSRLLYALAPDGARNLLEEVEKYGLMIVFILVMLGGTLLSKYFSFATGAILDGFTWFVGLFGA